MTTECEAACAQMQEQEDHVIRKSAGIRFDRTVNLGHLISMGTVVVTLIVGGAAMHSRVAVVEAQMVRQTDILERSIRADEKLQAIRERVDKLERER